MNRNEAAHAANQRIDWTDATVDTTARKVTMVYSTRLSDDLATWLEDEATRRDINPSAALRELVADAKRNAEQDKTVTVRLSDLHQVINQIADRAEAA
ncbi:hypothetical protein ACFYUR_19205 [Micromonospora haikouensis]|uniref:hypothetical protein n=1 Tax=Micromonospora haikouensis TaxID=686309 RepID=UPI003677DCD1